MFERVLKILFSHFFVVPQKRVFTYYVITFFPDCYDKDIQQIIIVFYFFNYFTLQKKLFASDIIRPTPLPNSHAHAF